MPGICAASQIGEKKKEKRKIGKEKSETDLYFTVLILILKLKKIFFIKEKVSIKKVFKKAFV